MIDKELVVKEYEAHKETLAHNHRLIDVYDGNLLHYLEKELRATFSEDTFKSIKARLAPINLLKKVVQKLSPVYSPPPSRRIVGTDQDKEIFDWYVENLNPNKFFRRAARFYSLARSCLVESLIDNGSPKMRVMRNDGYFVIGDDPVDEERVTHVVKFEKRLKGHKQVTVFFVYTDTEFLIFDDDLDEYREEMFLIGNPEGVNRLGRLPFSYEKDSEIRLFPRPDSDTFKMTMLIPVILSDLNYATMYQCFSIIYTMNIDSSEFTISPNVVVEMKQQPGTEGDPSIGQIKPTVDYAGVLQTLQTQVALWLNSRGIRPGAVGAATQENVQNGISKMIDEMDTYEIRRELANTFESLENGFWERLIRVEHPYYVANGLLPNEYAKPFSADAYVDITFAPQNAAFSKKDKILELKEEMGIGLTTRRRAIAELNPLMNDDEIDELIAELEAENTTTVEGSFTGSEDENEESSTDG